MAFKQVVFIPRGIEKSKINRPFLLFQTLFLIICDEAHTSPIENSLVDQVVNDPDTINSKNCVVLVSYTNVPDELTGIVSILLSSIFDKKLSYFSKGLAQKWALNELSRGEICVANFRPPCDIYDRQCSC
jgi:hypothetical protein